MKTHVLLAEDDPTFAGVVKQFYEEVPKAFKGEADLIVVQELAMMQRVLSTNGVSMIVLDLTLPDSLQAQTIEWIAGHAGKVPPIMVITGDERIEVRDKCLLAGAKGFALKQHIVKSANFFFADCYNLHVLSLRHG